MARKRHLNAVPNPEDPSAIQNVISPNNDGVVNADEPNGNLRLTATGQNTPGSADPNEGAERTWRALSAMKLACEQHRCAFYVVLSGAGPLGDVAAASIETVQFGLSSGRPLIHGFVIDGVLYVSGIDAGSLQTRERERLLSLARHCANA